MTITRDQELWAMALWVEREHGDDGDRFIAKRVLHFAETGEAGGGCGMSARWHASRGRLEQRREDGN